MHWTYLTLAIVLEVIGTTALKLSDGLNRLVPTVLMFGCYGLAFWCNAMALRRLDLSVTYAIWSGVGTAALAVIGMTWLKEPVNAMKIGSIALILLGVVGLHLSTTTAQAAQ